MDKFRLELTDELVDALDAYLEFCAEPGVEFSIKGFGQYLVDSYEL